MRIRRAVECVVLFVVAPSVLAALMHPRLVFPAIWAIGALSLALLLLDPSFDRKHLWNFRGLRDSLLRILARFAVLGPALAFALLLFEPHRLFTLPRERPGLWAIIMVGYPILSVLPQEVAFRAMFIHRYREVFPRAASLILASAIAFGYAHVIMRNGWAIGFSAVGGVLFAATYLRSRSLLAASAEHALYGCWIFTVGWGWYFFGGSMAAAPAITPVQP
ncbi:MAG: CPBP family intramembrane glutamic endopeptidase [Phycisphaerales bacterium]